MDRDSPNSRSTGSSQPSRSVRNNSSYTTRTQYSTYRDDVSASSNSSRNHVPAWAAPANSTADNFQDEDVFSEGAHSYVPPSGTASNHGSTIVGTFRPSLEDMVDVNVSAHGKNFSNSASDGLFRKTQDRGIRRHSVFALGAEDMEYDAVDMTKRSRCFTGVLCCLVISLAVITIAVVATLGRQNAESIPDTAAFDPSPGVSILDPTLSASDCDFEGILEPDVFLQCRCHGHISTFAEGVLVKYHDLRTNFVNQYIFPDFNSKMDSCDAANLALVWLADDEYPEIGEVFDRYMLAFLYASWKGYAWTRQDNWLLTSQSHCEWYGVECDSRRLTVDLLLGKNNLQGEIPSEITIFESLRSLDIGENKIGGRIPTEIGRFQSLVNLRLSANSLTLSIPTQFGLLANLKSLELDHNNLAETIPTQIFRIPNLNFLDISSNHFSGTIPTEVGSLSNCRK